MVVLGAGLQFGLASAQQQALSNAQQQVLASQLAGGLPPSALNAQLLNNFGNLSGAFLSQGGNMGPPPNGSTGLAPLPGPLRQAILPHPPPPPHNPVLPIGL